MTAPRPSRIALIGSPNSGKTSIFNQLTGMRRRVANYPGVTVDFVEGELRGASDAVVVDLPGTYSLDALSPDEDVTVTELSGGHGAAPDLALVVADATTLDRSMPFIAEVLATGRPSIVVLTMIDELKARYGRLDIGRLHRRLGVPVVGVVGNRGLGVDDLLAQLEDPGKWHPSWAELPEAGADAAERRAWAARTLDEVYKAPREMDPRTRRIDRVLLHPVLGLLVFALVMTLFFQIIFTVAAPVQDLFESGVLALGEAVGGILPDGHLRSFLVDGVIAGVGGVVVFVPQIALLLLMIALLEGTGYMARAAFLIDRVMGWVGLEGRSFVALLSSYACAVPGIMAARTVPDPRSRLATILVAPLMTCSARLPVYTLLIAAFIPRSTVLGVLNVQGLVLLALYVGGSLSALIAAAFIRRGMRRGRTFPFYLELPPYRVPTLRSVWSRVQVGVFGFMKKAGTVILGSMVVLWFLLNFPQQGAEPDAGAEVAAQDGAQASQRETQASLSYAGQLGRTIEPAIEPLGFDWKIGIGLIASFAAREVIVGTLAQIYAVEGGDEDTEGLVEQLRADTRPDGTPVWSLATALSLLVFFVFALQCVSTLAIIWKETRALRWPVFAFSYMLALAWLASFATYRIALAAGG